MKKLFLLILAAVMFFNFASCGSSSNSPTQSAPAQNSVSVEQPAEETAPVQTAPQTQTVQNVVSPAETAPVQKLPVVTPVPVEAVPAETVPAETVPAEFGNTAPISAMQDTIIAEGGGYKAEVVSARLEKDYTGADVIAVCFNFTNSNNSDMSFSQVIDVIVTQNGKTLSSDFIIITSDSFDGTAMNAVVPVKNGTTIACSYAYPYSSSAPLDISLKIYDNFLNRHVFGSASGTVSISG